MATQPTQKPKSTKPAAPKSPSPKALLAMADKHDNWARGLRSQAAKLLGKAEKKGAKK